MKKMHAKKFGLAVGITFSVFYITCVILMAIIGRENTILFSNSLMHGIDVTSIIRMKVPFGEVILGIFGMFAIGWLMGTVIVSMYNFLLKKST